MKKIIAPSRRGFCAGITALTAAPAILRAQGSWPKAGTIRMIIPFPPAGATDIIGRVLAEGLSQRWGTQIIVENKPGAGGNIGVDQAARAAPDGNTLLVASVGMATNPYLYKSLAYDPIRDFDPVSLLAMVPNIMVVPKNSPATDLADFVARATAEPGKFTFASSGIGTSLHLSGELFNKLTGAKMVHVPYKGSGDAKNDLVAGRFDCMFDNITSVLPLAREGVIRALGITTAKPSPLAPELKPIAGAVPGFDVSSWFALFTPARVPAEIAARIAADTQAVLGEKAVADKLATLGGEIVASTPGEMRAFLQAESAKWGALIRELGISAG
ncbi:MAG: tripartite tricarboxylate transporter substrate binding protein [Proteobacteria bacterium]|nr:tripartite tricarboxylate transporter substrate binding protein [Pseudomonadota bacterium]